MKTPAVTHDELKQLLHYDPETGHFTWLQDRGGYRCRGMKAGHRNTKGYIQISLGYEDGKKVRHRAHRLAWLYMTGASPDHEVDHLNGVRDDNRWSNLRAASSGENNRNRCGLVGTSSGIKGVHQSKGRWICQCQTNGKRVTMGPFDDLELAEFVIQEYRTSHHGEFARHS